ncbi:MAG: PKD domain-containing protein [Chitinophagaceae bacterium]|nr:PKD domain-containing protein [Chitinophagaceae bacterium]
MTFLLFVAMFWINLLKAQISGSNLACQNSTFTYTNTPTSGFNYLWTITPSTAFIAQQNNNFADINFGGFGTYTITCSGTDGITTNTNDLIVNVDQIPNPMIISNSQVQCQTMQTTDAQSNNLVMPDDGCMRLCELSQTTFNVSNPFILNTYTWNAIGGVVITNGNSCTVQWGNAYAFTGQMSGASISVTETTPNGCSFTYSKCIELLTAPSSQLNSNITPYSGISYNICNQEIITFNLSGIANDIVYTYNWNFGDGTFSNMETPSHNYPNNTSGNPITYNGSVTITNECGCSQRINFVVIVESRMPVHIICNEVTCINHIETYTTDNPCNNTLWSCIGGTIISPNPAASIKVLWNNPGNNNTTSGFGTLTADITNCSGINSCKNIFSTTVPIFGSSIVHSYGGECIGQPIVIDVPQWPGTDFTFRISPSNPNTAGASIVSPNFNSNEAWINTTQNGVYQVEIDAVNTIKGCTQHYLTDPILSMEPPLLSGKADYCFGEDIIVNAINNSNSNQMMTMIKDNFGNIIWGPSQVSIATNGDMIFPFNLFPNAGTYNILVAYLGHCYSTFEVHIIAPPINIGSIVGNDLVCSGSNEVYSLANTVPNTHLVWQQVDGTLTANFTGNSINISFSDLGTKTISVWRVTDAMPHCSTLVQTLNINFINPTITITPNPASVCEDNTAVFSATTNTTPDSYNWILSNTTEANIIAGQSTDNVTIQCNHISPNAPTPLFLTCEITRCGQIYSNVIPVTIYTKPTITINTSPVPICSGTNTSINLNGLTGYTITSIDWDFGDGSPITTTTVANAQHVYNNYSNTNAIYTINSKITITSPGNCVFVVNAIGAITVYPYPDVNLSSSNGAMSVTDCDLNTPSNCFTLTLTAPTGSTVAWSNGAGNVLSTSVCQASPWASTNYFATITDANGCTATSLMFQLIYQCPGNASGGQVCNELPGVIPPTVSATGTALGCGLGFASGNAQSTFVSNGHTVISSTWSVQNAANLTSGNAITSQPNLQASSPIYTFNVPGDYIVEYSVVYNCTASGINTITATSTIHIPFITQFYMKMLCNSSNNGYDIQLFDHSAYFGGNNSGVIYNWTANGTSIATTQNAVISSASLGATYTFNLSMTNGTYNCDLTQNLSTPTSLPIADFDFNPTLDPLSTATAPSSCEGQAITFVNNSTGAAPVSAVWDFGDNTFSHIWEPGKVYEYDINKPQPTIELSISDIYGCTNVISKSIDIQDENFDVNISPQYTSNNVCIPPADITSNVVTFLVNNNSPIQYTWFSGNTPISAPSLNATYNNIYSSGTYWVQVSDAHGCTRNINPDVQNVIVQNPPPVLITGINHACENYSDPIVLDGAHGVPASVSSPGSITYTWYLNGAATSNTLATYSLANLAVGTYSITLEISYNPGYSGALNCTSNNFNNPYIITIYPTPIAPTITPPAVAINCDNYELEVIATHPDLGTFTWSNGMNGSPIHVFNGGALRCWFTSEFGCTNSADIEIEHAPSTYFWRFPQNACYTFCKDAINSAYINGPLQSLQAPNTQPFGVDFVSWQWNINGNVVNPNGNFNGNGVGMVEPLILADVPFASGAGAYSWTLQNSLCTQTTDPMQVDFINCCSFELNLVEIICIDAVNRIYQITVNGSNTNGCNSNAVNITMYNLVNNQPTGVIWNNLNPVVGSGPFVVIAQVHIQDVNVNDISFCIELVNTCGIGANKCKGCVIVPLPACNSGGGNKLSHIPPSNTDINNQNLLGSMYLYPNPANTTCNMQYSYTNELATPILHIYDAIGKLLYTEHLSQSKGIHTIDVSSWPAGAYMVQLVEDKQLVQTQRLLINNK